MRSGAIALLTLALTGCARADQELARFHARLSFAEPVATATPEPVAACTNGYGADFTGEEERFTHLGGIVLVDLGQTDEPWRYRPARVYARHLDRHDERRAEMLANGEDFYAAQFVHAVVPGGRVATITVDEPLNFSDVSLLPGGVTQFGGYTAADGELAVRCAAGPLTTAFPLGVIVQEPRCASITVQLDGRPPESRLIGFGKRACP